MSPDAGGGRRVTGSQLMSTAVQYTRAQINFGGLTPCLTYGINTLTHGTEIILNRHTFLVVVGTGSTAASLAAIMGKASICTNRAASIGTEATSIAEVASIGIEV
jgi:hypothetical protein